MHMMKGKLVLFEGIDGAGKSTLVAKLEQYLLEQGKRVLNVKQHAEQHQQLPEYSLLEQYDAVITAEPTNTLIGKTIREELISNKRAYGKESIAQAYAIDREIHYKRLVLPALERGIHVVQDRSVISSAFYQVLLGTAPSETALQHQFLDYAGNKLALATRPDLIIVPQLSAETAMKRINDRKKTDNAVYEQVELQKELAQYYHEKKWYQRLFRDEDIPLHFLNVEQEGTEEATRQSVIKLWESLKPFKA